MNLITKFTGPTKYDHHKFGSIWLNQVDDKESIFYIQISNSEDCPNWMRLEDYLKKLFQNYFFKQLTKEEIINMISDILN
jgi:hypothetical protein